VQLGDLHYDGSGGVTKDHEEANKWFRMAAEQGHPEALYSVGWSYFAGEGVERSVEDAAEWFEKASEAGHSKAMRQLAKLTFQGNGVEENPSKAHDLWVQAADLGDVESQALLGKLYTQGVEGQIEKDYQKALYRLRQAAQAGDPDSMHALGVAFDKGLGTPSNKDEALRWYKLAEARGFVSSDSLFRRASELYSGPNKNVKQAAQLFYVAAQKNHPAAAGNIAWFFYHGEGIPQDFLQAFQWAIRALKLGYSNAGFVAGQCCEFGHGVLADHQAAMQWYLHCIEGATDAEADERMKYKAMHAVGRCYYKGSHHDGLPENIAPDFKKAFYWWRRAAEEGNVTDAWNHLGDCYVRGHGCKKDREKARECWEKAAKGGCQEAVDGLHWLKGYSLKERLSIWIPTVLIVLLMAVVVAYFMVKYHEMSKDSWFVKRGAEDDAPPDPTASAAPPPPAPSP
jgi:TPR repeat protein